MPREGTKTLLYTFSPRVRFIEIIYAPGGDENTLKRILTAVETIEIRYAPGGDENVLAVISYGSIIKLRLDMPHEGTKTVP